MIALNALPDGLRRLRATLIVDPVRRVRAAVARVRRDGLPYPRLVWEFRPRRPPKSAAATARLAAAPREASRGEVMAAAAARPDRPPAPRGNLAHRLWGDGFALPGGQAEVLRLAGLLPLSPATTLLLVGQDAGGAAEAIARTRGAWISSYLPDPAQVKRAQELLRRLGRQATAQVWDQSGPPAFPARFHHHAMALEAMRTAADPRSVIEAIAPALKPGGQLVLLEVVADRPQACPARWLSLEGRAGPPPPAAMVEAWLRELGFALHVTQDVSERHAACVVEGWSRLLGEVSRGAERRDPGFAAALVAEAEAWLFRHRLIGAGVLRLHRWHASLTRSA